LKSFSFNLSTVFEVSDVGRGNLAISKLLALKNLGPFLLSTYYWMSCSTFLGGGGVVLEVDIRVIPIRYFRLVFGWYFLVITLPIPEENLVGTFWYYYFGGNPFFPRKGGHGSLFQGPSPHFEEKRVSRQTFKSSCQILWCSK
jgi:hypothetical protein